MAVVSNSSPLILFSKVGRLDLLREMVDEVFIPRAVFEEVVTEGAGRAGAAEIVRMSWIRLQSIVSWAVIEGLARNPGRGEAEAIALAVELGGEIPILIDDRLGRRLAQELGLHVVGSAGILVQAKERGMIPQVSPILDEMRALGLYLSDAARHQPLIAADELPDPGAESK